MPIIQYWQGKQIIIFRTLLIQNSFQSAICEFPFQNASNCTTSRVNQTYHRRLGMVSQCMEPHVYWQFIDPLWIDSSNKISSGYHVLRIIRYLDFYI